MQLPEDRVTEDQKKKSASRPRPSARNGDDFGAVDYRRTMVLLLSVGLLSTCGWVLWRYEDTGTVRAVASASGRIGLVLAALWLAWPSLEKPARWLPPGFAVLGVLVLAVLAAQPRLIIVMVPAFGGLLVLASIVRSLRP